MMAQPNLISSEPPEPAKVAVVSEPKARESAQRKSLLPWQKQQRKAERARYETITAGRPAVLCVDNVSVSFDGFKALNELTLVLDEGELRCIIGPNGAGKTTMLDVI